MHPLSSRSPSNNRSSRSSENSTSRRSDSWGESVLKSNFKLIKFVNSSLNLFNIINSYGINIERSSPYDDWSKPIRCPFVSHKGGNEKTPSFGYNFKEDRFNCFGCSGAGQAVEFVSLMEQISRHVVAEQLSKDITGYDLNNIEDIHDDNPKIDFILFSFSNFLCYLNQKYKNNQLKLEQINKISWWFDMYLVSKAPSGQIDVEELEQRVLRAKELLVDF